MFIICLLNYKYSRRSFTQKVQDLTCSRLKIFLEFRYFNTKKQNCRKKTF
jgi:hypothetical protein